MADLKITETPHHYCPSCQAPMSYTAGKDDLTPGDMSVCVYCQATLIFDPQAIGGLRGLTLTEWTELRQDDPEAYRELMAIVEYYKTHPVQPGERATVPPFMDWEELTP